MTSGRIETECLVVGGGPAGLVGATYLARFRRDTLVVDSGASRAAWIPETRNLIGFPAGISGPALLSRLRRQAGEYGARLMPGRISALQITPAGFRAESDAGTIDARRVLLATGGLDIEPKIDCIREAVREGLVRYCPICDAFEAAGRHIALISYGECRVREALLLRRYTRNMTVLTLGEEMTLGAGDRELLDAAGIALRQEPVLRIVRQGEQLAVHVEGGERPLLFDILYSALGTRLRSELALALGARADEQGALVTDAHMRTTVPGLFAAGDIVHGLSQISVAAGHAAIAATAINSDLLQEEISGMRKCRS